MSLYPDILFHFTDKESLYNILESTFRISYAREKINGPNEYRAFAVPMVSFCDLKLSEIKNHMKKYGQFGIGLTKEWANRNGLNPVLYMNRNAQIVDDLLSGLSGVYMHMNKLINEDEIQDLNASYVNIMNTYRYIKNYEGELIRNGKLVEDNFRFADEREWRYVPPLKTKGVNPFVAISKIKSKKQKNLYNDKVQHIRLHFQPDDIKYLIVQNDADIGHLINHLSLVKGRFNHDTRNRLASRILTSEQINMDI